MIPLSESAVRAAFTNVSLRERKAVVLPPAFDEIDWERRDYLGWRDAKQPQVGYVVGEIDGDPVGVLLRETEARPLRRPQCAWCNDVELPNDVVMFSAKRAGDAGRRGDTVGTLLCAEFECSRNVRRLPPSAYLGFDREAARQRRIDALRDNVAQFVRGIRDGA
ncbi:FBP domain-containing protein [Microbacterium sp. NPDC089189]|uniref:FBP domain-containing protein n=1 Tax=Microbacterium sp. NPDC089189 TaxID=3154972 RepID=UPI00342C1BD0